MTNSDNSNIDEIKALHIRYSAIVNNISIFYRVVMSFIFSMIILRKLPVEEYGLFAIIMAYLAIFQPVPGIWTWWVARYYARKRMELVSLGFSLTLIYGIFSSLFILILFTSFIKIYDINTMYLAILISVNLFLTVLYSYIRTILGVSRPYLVGYNIFIAESIRVIVAYYTIIVLKCGVAGIFVALIARNFVSIILSVLYTAKFRLNFPKPTLRRTELFTLIKNSYITIINTIYNQIKASSERLIVNIMTGSLVLPAYLNVAYIPRNFILGGASAFSSSLSPRLLRGKSKTDIEDILRISFIFLFFLLGSFIIYSKTILSLFRYEYLGISLLLSLYTCVFVLDAIRYLLGTISTSLERSDLYVSGLELRKTVLFKNPITSLIGIIIQISLSASIFYVELLMGIDDPVMLLLPFPLVALFIHLVIVIIFYKRSVNMIHYHIPIREIVASIMGIFGIFILSSLTGYINYEVHSIFKELPNLLEIIVCSIVTYFTIILALSPWFRSFLSKGLNKIFNRIVRSLKSD